MTPRRRGTFWGCGGRTGEQPLTRRTSAPASLPHRLHLVRPHTRPTGSAGRTATVPRPAVAAVSGCGSADCPSVPLEKQAWVDEAGALVDRFGTTWMVNITPQHT